MSEQADKDVLWAIVRDCLGEIYAIKSPRACQLSADLHSKVEKTSKRPFRDLFYHAEPIDIAGDIAGHGTNELSKAKWKKYDTILARHDW